MSYFGTLWAFFQTQVHSISVWIQKFLGTSGEWTEKILVSLALILPILLIRKFALRRIPQLIEDLQRRYLAVRTINYVSGGLVLLVLVVQVFEGGKGLATYIGLISAGFAVALQAPISNVAGWVFISIRKPFVIGDRIELNQMMGDVVDTGVFHFSLLEVGNWCDNQSTGRITHIPNGQVFTHSVHNFTAGFNFIWNEIPVAITFESDWKEAKRLLLDIAEKHSNLSAIEAKRQVRNATEKYMINWRYFTPIVWTDVSQNGVSLTIRYLTEVRRRRSSESSMWEEILTAFREHPEIFFAYPTVRYTRGLAQGENGEPPPMGSETV